MEFIARLKKFALADEGQDLLEYALLVALIALVSVGVIGIAGRQREDDLRQHRHGSWRRRRRKRGLTDSGRGAEHGSAPALERDGVMARLMTMVAASGLDDETGQDLMEYGLLAALIAIVAMASVSALGDTIYNIFWVKIGQAI